MPPLRLPTPQRQTTSPKSSVTPASSRTSSPASSRYSSPASTLASTRQRVLHSRLSTPAYPQVRCSRGTALQITIPPTKKLTHPHTTTYLTATTSTTTDCAASGVSWRRGTSQRRSSKIRFTMQLCFNAHCQGETHSTHTTTSRPP